MWNTFVSMWNTFCLGGSCPIDPLPPQHIHPPSLCSSQGRCLPPLLRIPWHHSIFPRSFLPTIDFGEGFRFDEPFNFDDFGEGIGVIAAGGLLSYGTYDNDSCSFSAEMSVRLCRCHHRCKWRSPYRLYRKESVLLSSWYRNFLWLRLMHDLTYELSTYNRFGEFRCYFKCLSQRSRN